MTRLNVRKTYKLYVGGAFVRSESGRYDRALKAGVIWQNTYNKFDPTAAFGGYKESGFGREGGAAGLRPYLRVS